MGAPTGTGRDADTDAGTDAREHGRATVDGQQAISAVDRDDPKSQLESRLRRSYIVLVRSSNSRVSLLGVFK
jgi:hypothetical protein